MVGVGYAQRVTARKPEKLIWLDFVRLSGVLRQQKLSEVGSVNKLLELVRQEEHVLSRIRVLVQNIPGFGYLPYQLLLDITRSHPLGGVFRVGSVGQYCVEIVDHINLPQY
jgi:hypothetical protein